MVKATGVPGWSTVPAVGVCVSTVCGGLTVVVVAGPVVGALLVDVEVVGAPVVDVELGRRRAATTATAPTGASRTSRCM